MAKLLNDIQNEIGGQPGPKCRVEQILQTLGKEDREDLVAALGDPTITGSAIYRALAKRGIKLADHTIHRHRRKDCACGIGR